MQLIVRSTIIILVALNVDGLISSYAKQLKNTPSLPPKVLEPLPPANQRDGLTYPLLTNPWKTSQTALEMTRGGKSDGKPGKTKSAKKGKKDPSGPTGLARFKSIGQTALGLSGAVLAVSAAPGLLTIAPTVPLAQVATVAVSVQLSKWFGKGLGLTFRKFRPLSSFDSTAFNAKTSKFESKGEAECRRVLETLFKEPFPSARPDFLSNPVTGVNLELDCYNKDLQLAVEYNGIQHYEYTPRFHKNKEAFMNQKYRDELKRQMCELHGVNLIEVPNMLKIVDIEAFIVKELKPSNWGTFFGS